MHCAAGVCLGVIARWCKERGITEDVAYFFENGDMGLPGFADAVGRIVKASRTFKTQMGIHSVSAASKADFPLLQTADILAWEVGRQIPKRLGVEQTPIRPAFDRLLSVNVEIEYLDGAALRTLADHSTEEECRRMADLYGMRIKRTRRRRGEPNN